MSDLISKSKLLSNLNDWALSEAPDERMDEAERDYQEIVYEVITNCMQTVEEQPAVEAKEVVRGWWKYTPTYRKYECSICKETISLGNDLNAHTNFCPNCGADMRKDV